MKSNCQISQEHRAQRDKCCPSVFEYGSGKQRQTGDCRNVWGMRHNAEESSDYDRNNNRNPLVTGYS